MWQKWKAWRMTLFNWVLFFCLRNALSVFRLFCTATYKIRISLLKHISDLIMFICLQCYFSWQVFRVWPVWVMNDIMFHKAGCFLRDFAILRRLKQVVPNQEWRCFPGTLDNVWRHFCLSPLVSRVLILFYWQRPGTLLSSQQSTGTWHRMPQ